MRRRSRGNTDAFFAVGNSGIRFLCRNHYRRYTYPPFLKKKTRLPTHNALQRRLNVLAESLDRIIASLDKEEGGYDFLREINKLIYTADKLIYAVTLVSERERDTGISSIAQQLETCKNKLAPYKYRTKVKDDADGLKDARADLNAAILAMDSILGRDNELKEKKAKRYNG